jgi:preprotein translocase subunit SecD
VLDPQITQQGDSRIVVQLAGVEDPDRIKELLGKTAHMTFRWWTRRPTPTRRVPAAAGRGIPADAGQSPRQKIAVRKRVDVDGADLTDARAGTNRRPASGW